MTAVVGRVKRTLPRAFVAGAMLVQGLGMIVGGPETYSVSAYDVVFGIMPKVAWGIAFTAAAVALVVRRHPVTLGASIFVMFAWAIGLNLAWWFHGDDGERLSSTPTLGVSWLALASVTLWSAGRPGGVQ